MSFSLPFIKKVDDNPEKEHSTPLDIKKLEKETEQQEPKVAKTEEKTDQKKEKEKLPKSDPNNPHVATIVYKPSLSFLKVDKYLLITIISVIFCVSGLGFWLYVQFFMSP